MRDTRFFRLVVWVNGVVPASLLAYDAFRGQLGANPVNFAIRTTGTLALTFLSLSLLVTPIRKLTGWMWLISCRRALGLFAFFYAATHFSLFFALDRNFSVSSTLAEMVKRPYLVVGSIGLFSMALLAATSTNGMIRRLGAKKWQALHRLAYLAAIAGVVHYYMLVKADVRLPLAFGAAVATLLGYRLVVAVAGRISRRSATPIATAVSSVPLAPEPAKRPKFWSGQMRVARIFEETPEIRTFRFQALDGGPLPFGYLPGQYLNIGLEIGGKRVNRSYTISSSPSRGEYCEITVKREEAGTASRHLHDAVREGDIVKVSAPAGVFTFTGKEADGIVLLGAGVGITPLMSVVRYLTDRSWPGEIHLVHCVRTERDAVFREELAYLQRRFPNLHVTVTHTRARTASVMQGRITGEMLRRTVPSLETRLVHICGPSAMMEMTKGMLRELGVAPERIKLEAFERAVASAAAEAVDEADAGAEEAAPAPIAAVAGARSNGDASVTFTVSGKTVPVTAEESVLEAAENAGVSIEYECRSGICGRCVTKLLSGTVRMESREALSAKDERRGYILACQARAVGEVKVEA